MFLCLYSLYYFHISSYICSVYMCIMLLIFRWYITIVYTSAVLWWFEASPIANHSFGASPALSGCASGFRHHYQSHFCKEPKRVHDCHRSHGKVGKMRLTKWKSSIACVMWLEKNMSGFCLQIHGHNILTIWDWIAWCGVRSQSFLWLVVAILCIIEFPWKLVFFRKNPASAEPQ